MKIHFVLISNLTLSISGEEYKMRFNVGDNSLKFEWYGQILSFDLISGKYGVYFPFNKETVFIDPVKEMEDIEFI